MTFKLKLIIKRSSYAKRFILQIVRKRKVVNGRIYQIDSGKGKGKGTPQGKSPARRRGQPLQDWNKPKTPDYPCAAKNLVITQQCQTRTLTRDSYCTVHHQMSFVFTYRKLHAIQ